MSKKEDIIIDYITGMAKNNTGAEANRQLCERRLVLEKGYLKSDIIVDAPIRVDIDGEPYESTVDLVICVMGKRYMAIKCAAGSLESRKMEIIAAARLLEAYQIPFAGASDGETLLVWDAVSGRRIGQGFSGLPDKATAEKQFETVLLAPLTSRSRERQQLIFRSYDSMTVNKSDTTRPAD